MGGRNRESASRMADVVRAHRHQAGLTQQELATRAGLSLAALRDLEQGRRSRPRPGSLTALAEALRLNASQAAELTSIAAAARRRSALVPGQRPADAGPPWGPDGQPRRGLWLSVLGPLEASLDGVPLSLGPPLRRALLGQLAMNAGGVVRRDTIVDVLWGQSAPSTAPSLVQAHVSRLRKLLPPDARGNPVIASAGGGYRLQLRCDQLDLLAFKALVINAEAARGAGDDLMACDLYEQALALWRGDPLADIEVLHDQPGVADQRRQFADALLWYSEVACDLGFHDRVLPHLHTLAAAEPLNERVHARLMIALAGAGQQAAAFHVFEGIRGRLDREFAVYPGEELANAHLRVLRQDIPGIRRSSGPPPADPVIPRQLPASARYFTGREREHRMLSELLARASPEAGKVAVAALTGMAGVGKTALAVNWAHQVADRFPDGQLFADLRGFRHLGAPVQPAEVLRGFLTALGVPASRISAGTAERAALYRSTLASRRVLIVLDNARDAEQVRPLLPGASGCLVLVTSRNRLTGLAAADGAHLLALRSLTDEESYRLLTRTLGTERVTAERAAIDELVALCARLPLALCNAVARAAARPGLPLAMLVAELRDRCGRLDALETGEPATSVRVVFSLSYAKLTGLAAEMFLMLGMFPGAELTVPAAAALAGLDRSQAQAALARLCDEHLLAEQAPGRYTCHELLRAYAAESASTWLDEAERHDAVYRMLDYYLHTASAVSALLCPHLAPRVLGAPRPGGAPEHFRDARQAAEWARSERSALFAAISLAAEGGYHPHAWELPWAAGAFLDGEESWRKLADAQRAALELAFRLGDLGGAALAHYHLGWLMLRLGDHSAARRHLDGFVKVAARSDGGRRPGRPDPGAGSRRPRDDIADSLVRAGRALRLYRGDDHALSDAGPRFTSSGIT
jgi:DNA-binding SARP family transcriptional activator/DNA-binding XRE family transcriptional regulator